MKAEDWLAINRTTKVTLIVMTPILYIAIINAEQIMLFHFYFFLFFFFF